MVVLDDLLLRPLYKTNVVLPVVVEMLKLSSGSMEYVTRPLSPLSLSAALTVSTFTPAPVSSATDTWTRVTALTVSVVVVIIKRWLIGLVVKHRS